MCYLQTNTVAVCVCFERNYAQNKHTVMYKTNTQLRTKQTHSYVQNKHTITHKTNTQLRTKQTHNYAQNKHTHSYAQNESYVCNYGSMNPG